jgi:lipopolysaccharide transport system ATP-binding protein
MDAGVVIRAEGLGKTYLIGHQAERERYRSLRDVIARNTRNFARSARDLISGRPLIAGDVVEEFWALRDLDFEIRRGEVVGVIGRNGAGKSTLLKILSRITEPRQGRVEIRGRVASLLEVGTGFHPELTGRENIFLNGAILGMGRAEIRRKFDEIVDFAGVERFLDTPVKRFSSGMYVRLAFAVAAHLEPEILVIDEVLAVGDAEFQKKCLGKMSEVAGHGRTVLFVSHNMAAVKSLTERCILLDGGRLAFSGPTDEAIGQYARANAAGALEGPADWGKGKHTTITGARLLNERMEPVGSYSAGEPLWLEVAVETDGTRGLSLELMLADQGRAKLGLASLYQFHGQTLSKEPGQYRYRLRLDALHLAAGQYAFDVVTSVPNTGWDHYVEEAVAFDVTFSNPGGLPWNFNQSYGYGALAIPFSEVAVERVGPA